MDIKDNSQIKDDKDKFMRSSNDTNLNFNFNDLLDAPHADCDHSNVLNNLNKGSDLDKKDFLSHAHKEQILTRRIIREKNIETSYIETADPYASSIFIAQRVLGFDDELYS